MCLMSAPSQTHSFQTLAHSFSLLPLFSTLAPFVFNGLRTLLQNTRGWGLSKRFWNTIAGLLRWAFTERLDWAMVQNGRAERSTLPPEKIMPSFGGALAARGGRPRLATLPGSSRGARATAEEGSMMIFIRSQTVRMALMIWSSLA